MAIRVAASLTEEASWYDILMAHMTDVETGAIENLPVDVLTRGLKRMYGYKSDIYDPDTPTMTQAMGGPHRA